MVYTVHDTRLMVVRSVMGDWVLVLMGVIVLGLDENVLDIDSLWIPTAALLSNSLLPVPSMQQ